MGVTDQKKRSSLHVVNLRQPHLLVEGILTNPIWRYTQPLELGDMKLTQRHCCLDAIVLVFYMQPKSIQSLYFQVFSKLAISLHSFTPKLDI